ncbi:MAG: DUF58 domain-containing protein [Planctomycetota bacterium]
MNEIAMSLARRLSRWFLGLAVWPVQTWSRLTVDGWLFFGLTLLCGLLSVGSNSWSNIPLLMCLVLLALWLVAIWHGSHSLRGIRFKRSHVERAFANEPVTVTLLMSNNSRLPVAGLVISEKLEAERLLPVRMGQAGAAEIEKRVNVRSATVVAQGAAFVTVISARAEDYSRYTLAVRRRGIYRFGETSIETVFPFGFFHSRSVRSAPGRLVVYPRLGEVDGKFLEELELSLHFMRCSRPSRAEEDFRGLREYRDGDNPKWIHWRSSAHLQKMLVKEFEEPQAKRVLLLLDTNLQHLGTQRFAAIEQAISFTGTLARDLIRRGYEVEVAALQPHNRLLRVVAHRERRNFDALLELLAGLQRDDTRTLSDMIETLGRRSLQHVYVLVLGLGSLRTKSNLGWLHTIDNIVKIFDARGDEFRRIFRPVSSGSAREQFTEEDILMGIGDDEAIEEDAAVAIK